MVLSHLATRCSEILVQLARAFPKALLIAAMNLDTQTSSDNNRSISPSLSILGIESELEILDLSLDITPSRKINGIPVQAIANTNQISAIIGARQIENPKRQYYLVQMKNSTLY